MCHCVHECVRVQVAMFVNVSPVLWNAQETVCSLKFASRCRNVQLGKAKRVIDTAAGASLLGGASVDTGL